MADLSKIRLNGTNYNLKDATARNAINNFEETDPVFSASAAAGIKSTDITNWNNKLSSYTETDPTVPAWAKAANKPTYTANEVGALPSTTVIPTITDTYSSTSHNGMSGIAVNSAITTAIGNINSFDIAIVSSTSAVTTPNNHTIYFVPQAVNSSTHDEYMYINNAWELIGTTTIDLSGYMQKGIDYVTAGQKSGTTLGQYATTEGAGTEASETAAHAEGGGTVASAMTAHAEGENTVASARGAHAEGFSTVASGLYSHSENYQSIAYGNYSHAEGLSTAANGESSHAEGGGTAANGACSHAEGDATIAQTKSQHVFGEFNVADTGSALTRGTYVEIVGNGSFANGTENRSNARTLDWNGNEWLAGKLTLGASPTANMDAATKQYVDNAIPTVPTNVSSFTNDSGYLTLATLPIYDGTVQNG